jgi:hypothetical protein
MAPIGATEEMVVVGGKGTYLFVRTPLGAREDEYIRMLVIYI